MKVALVPSFIVKEDGNTIPYIPLGLLSIKSGITKIGLSDVSLIDLNCKFKQANIDLLSFYQNTAQNFVDSGFDLVGFSSTSSSFHHIVSISKRIKELSSKVKVVIGGSGPHSQNMARSILEAFPCIDYLVMGEGEQSFDSLLHCIKKNKIPFGVAGVAFRNNDNIILGNPASLIKDLDQLPFPAFEAMKANDYVYSYKNSEAIIHLEEGRGCPFRCAFCSTSEFWQHSPRQKSFKRMIREMDAMNQLYSIRTFSLINDCFNSYPEHFIKFCRNMNNRNREYTWGCSLRIDLMKPDLFDLLWDAGCRAFFSGIESGSRDMQRLIGKKLNLDQVVPKLEYAAKKGFHVRISFIIGFPEETLKDLRQTIQLHKQCLDVGVTESHVNLLTPLHGSRFLQSGMYNLDFDGHGSTLSNNIILDEHIPWIKDYPQIFCAFYHFRPYFVNRREFIELETLSNMLTSLYPQTPIVPPQ